MINKRDYNDTNKKQSSKQHETVKHQKSIKQYFKNKKVDISENINIKTLTLEIKYLANEIIDLIINLIKNNKSKNDLHILIIKFWNHNNNMKAS